MNNNACFMVLCGAVYYSTLVYLDETLVDFVACQ